MMPLWVLISSSHHPAMSDFIRDHNRKAWDALVHKKQVFTRPAADDEVHDPLGTVDKAGWLGGSVAASGCCASLREAAVKAFLYAAAGADVTVVDISPEQLRLDRVAAAERGLQVRTVEASMDDLSALRDGSFDVVIHPVSTCICPTCSRCSAKSRGSRSPAGSTLVNTRRRRACKASKALGWAGLSTCGALLSHRPPAPGRPAAGLREEGTLEFLHRWEELVGGICRAGFAIEDLLEPMHAKPDAPPGEFGHRATFIAPYVRIKARRTDAAGTTPEGATKPRVWIP